MDVMHEHVGGLDVHKETVVACVRVQSGGKPSRQCETFDTTTAGLLALLAWLKASGCTQVAMEATGVYWKPVWAILSDGDFELVLANAAHIKNVPGRKTDVNDAMWIADLLACGLIRQASCPTRRCRTCAPCCAPAPNSCVSRPATPSASTRPWRRRTSSSLRW